MAIRMSSQDFIALLPFIVSLTGALLVIIVVSWKRNHLLAATLSFAGLAAAFGSLWPASAVAPRQVASLLVIDHYTIFYSGLVIVSTAAVVVMAYIYFSGHEGRAEEFYILLLLAAVGCETLTASAHFVSFLLGLEILSVSLYGMAGYLIDRRHSLEAGVKYLVLAAASSAFLLFGMALIYADLGTMEFTRIGDLLRFTSNYAWNFAGMALIFTGVGFKLGVVPFHLWTPDVYQGSPAPATAFLATASKTAMVAVVIRFFYVAHTMSALTAVFAIIAIASMIAGNLLALLQSNVKRILAYSSIAHFGYILVPFLASTSRAVEAVTFYLAAYSVTMLGALGIISGLSTSERDADRLEDFRGLFWRRPAISGAFTAMLLSLAGIPTTAGFIAKFYIITAAAAATQWMLLFVLIVTSAVGLFYYLRIVVMMYSAPVQSGAPAGRVALATGVLIGILAAILIWLGIYPTPLLQWIHHSPIAGV